jgi:carbamoylphosphate synthase small subunit
MLHIPVTRLTGGQSRLNQAIQFSSIASNWRSEENAEQFLTDNGVPVAAEIDTRALFRHLRTRGVHTMNEAERGLPNRRTDRDNALR